MLEKAAIEEEHQLLKKHLLDESAIIELSPKYSVAKTNQIADKVLSEVKKMKNVLVENANLKGNFMTLGEHRFYLIILFEKSQHI